MKKEYMKPAAVISVFQNADIITASVDDAFVENDNLVEDDFD